MIKAFLYPILSCLFLDRFLLIKSLQDIATLGVVNVRYCGYIASVKVQGIDNASANTPLQSQEELLDQPDGGANALNINRFVGHDLSCNYTS